MSNENENTPEVDQPEMTGTVDTTSDSHESADATSSIFDDADKRFAELNIPEGISHAVLPDPAESGEDALKVSYDDYNSKMNDPTQRALRDGYAPGTSPDELAARQEVADEDGRADDEKVEKEIEQTPNSERTAPATNEVTDTTGVSDVAHSEGQTEQAEGEAEDEDTTSKSIDLDKATAKEIVEYLKTADKAERDRVLEAELERENPRQTVLNAAE